MNVNNVVLAGNVTRLPELRWTPKGTAVIDIAIAVNKVWYDSDHQKHEQVSYHEVTFFGKPAEVLEKHVQKGTGLYVQGELRQESWEDKEGKKRTKTKVIGDHFQFTGARREESDRGGKHAPAPAPGPPARQDDDDEIPW